MGRREREEKFASALALYNSGDFEAVAKEMGSELRMHRRSDAPEANEVLSGAEAMEALMRPTVFSEQHLEPIELEHHENNLMAHMRFSARGAGSGIPVDAEAWFIFFFAGDEVLRVEMYQEAGEARRAFLA